MDIERERRELLQLASAADRLHQYRNNIHAHTSSLGLVIGISVFLCVVQGLAVWPGNYLPAARIDLFDSHHEILRQFAGEHADRLIENQKRLMGTRQGRYQDDSPLLKNSRKQHGTDETVDSRSPSNRPEPKTVLKVQHGDLPDEHPHHTHHFVSYLERHPHTASIRWLLGMTLLLVPLWIGLWPFVLRERLSMRLLYFSSAICVSSAALNTAILLLRIHLLVVYGSSLIALLGVIATVVTLILETRAIVSLYLLQGLISLAAHKLQTHVEYTRGTLHAYQAPESVTKEYAPVERSRVEQWLFERFCGMCTCCNKQTRRNVSTGQHPRHAHRE